MSETPDSGRRNRALRIGTAIAMLPLVLLLLSAILFGQPLSILGLIVASASALVTGLLIRQGGHRASRLLGGLLALIGAVSLAGLAALAVAGPMGY